MPNITPRKNKNGEIVSYRIRVFKGYDSSGKQLKPYVMTWRPAPNMTAKQIEKELQRTAHAFEERCRSGLQSENPKLTLSDFIPQYLDIVKGSLSPATFEFYNHVIFELIVPALGHLKLSAIKPIHIQEFVQQLSELRPRGKAHAAKADKTISASTVKRYLCVLQSIFKQAVKLDIISSNPASAEKLTLPKVTAPKIEIFSKQEAAEMLACLEKEPLQFQVLIQLAIMAGLRRGELVALKFSDFDKAANTVTISRAAIKLKGEPVIIKPPKDYEVRTVTINAHCIELVEMLEAEKQQEAERLGSAWHENGYLFTQWNGEIMSPQTPTKQFSQFLAKNKLQHRKFHALRHTSATLLLYGGVNIKQVQERLGHSDIETTNKYLHYLSEADIEAANVLSNMLTTESNVIELDKQAQ